MLPPAIVIDTGTGFTKAGFAGSDNPKSTFPTVIGVPKETMQVIGGKNVDFYVGHEAFLKEDLVNIRRPMENGSIINWDEIEKLWHHTFYNELLVVPDQYPVILTEKENVTQQSREKSIQLLFETFEVPGYYSGVQSIFALFSCGLTTGIVWDAGDGYSSVVPIYEGYQQPHGVLRSNLSGQLLTKNLCERLEKKGTDVSFLKPNDINGIKENECRVRKVIDEEHLAKTKKDTSRRRKSSAACQEAKLDELMVDYDTPEILFNPKIIELNEPSIPQLIVNSLLLVDPAVRYEMLPSVVLCGGTSMFKGLPERMETEIRSIDIKSLLQRGEQLPSPKRRTRVQMFGPSVNTKTDFLHDDDFTLALTPQELNEMTTEGLERMMNPDILTGKKSVEEQSQSKKLKPKEVPEQEQDIIIPEAENLRLKMPGDFFSLNSGGDEQIYLPLTDDELLLTNNGYIVSLEKHKELLKKHLARKIRTRVNLNANVIAAPERKNAVWIGGSVFGSMPQFQDLLITKQEYQETGQWIVHTKCYS